MEDHALCQPDMQVHWSHSLHQIDHGHLGEETIHELQGLKLRWHHVHAALVTQREKVLARERERESDNDRQSEYCRVRAVV